MFVDPSLKVCRDRSDPTEWQEPVRPHSPETTHQDSEARAEQTAGQTNVAAM